jgi:retinol dehydrogenase-12
LTLLIVDEVFIVTGAASGVGFELASILYEKGAKVYVAARSADKARDAIEEIKTQDPHGHGQLVPLVVDLSDMTSVRSAAEHFLEQESRLDVLVNNAGVMQPPAGSKSKQVRAGSPVGFVWLTAQGYDLEMGTNVLGPFLLTRLLQPLLRKTAASMPAGSVRCVWVSSMIAIGTPKGGIILDEKTGEPKVLCNAMENYMHSKVGNLFIAKEASQRDKDGILHVVSPSNLRSDCITKSPL